MTETPLHNVGPDVIRAGDQFRIEGADEVSGTAIALTDCTVITHIDGRQQAVFMVEIPLDHRFASIRRGLDGE